MNQIIDAMLALDKSPALHWRVELTPKEAMEFAKKVEDANLISFIGKMNQIIPRPDYGTENQNTGLPIHTFYIGKENTRVIYVDVVKTYLFGMNIDYTWLENQIRAEATECCADEIDLRSDLQAEPLLFKMRIWWD